MKRAAFTFQVRLDKLEEYKAHHRAVWPEMLQALRETGWGNYSIFLRDDGLIVGYVETPTGLTAAQAGMATRAINTRWQETMAPYVVQGTRPDEMFYELEEVFHLD